MTSPSDRIEISLAAGQLRRQDELIALLKATERRLDAVQTQLLEQQGTIRHLRESLRDDQFEIRRLELERDNALALLKKHQCTR